MKIDWILKLNYIRNTVDDWITGTCKASEPWSAKSSFSSPGNLFQFPQTKGPVVHLTFLFKVGFLMALDKRDHGHNVTTNDFADLPQDFSFVFIQDNDAFFKNPDMRQLDDEIGDLDAFIKDTESMIVSELEEDILDCESELWSTFGALAELDCILSFAGCASDLNYIKPEILIEDEGTYYRIENGRHPLQELIIDDEFIANSTAVNSTKRVNIITGSNFSG